MKVGLLIFIEMLKWICFTGLIFTGIWGNDLKDLIFFGFALICLIVLKELFIKKEIGGIK